MKITPQYLKFKGAVYVKAAENHAPVDQVFQVLQDEFPELNLDPRGFLITWVPWSSGRRALTLYNKLSKRLGYELDRLGVPYQFLPSRGKLQEDETASNEWLLNDGKRFVVYVELADIRTRNGQPVAEISVLLH
jgi:hypothetical protein